jgi:hypothetical protein
MRLIFFGVLLTLLSACSASESPSQVDEGASTRTGIAFAAPQEYAFGDGPIKVLRADFNQDGNPDLLSITPRQPSDTLTAADGTVHLQLYDNSSNSSVFPYSLQSQPPGTAQWRQDFVSLDFDNDTDIDLVVTDTANDQVQVLRNDNGTFQDNQSLTVGDVPAALHAADWNGDNTTDLAVANRDNDSVTLLQGSSTGFAVLQTLSTGEAPVGLESGDFDNDSDTDLAVLARGSTRLELWKNDGSGNFGSSPDATYATGTSPHSIVAGDWDCNGHIDLAVSNSGSDTLTLLYNNGSGGFTSTTLDTGRGPSALATADLNLDNVTDFLVAQRFTVSTRSGSYLTGDLSLLLSTGPGSPRTYAAAESFAGSSAAGRLLIADLNSDSRLDALVSLPSRNAVAVLSGLNYTGQLGCP